MFYRPAMRSIQAGTGISTATNKIGARQSRRSNAKAGGPMGLDKYQLRMAGLRQRANTT
jgi:hypothetical protein